MSGYQDIIICAAIGKNLIAITIDGIFTGTTGESSVRTITHKDVVAIFSVDYNIALNLVIVRCEVIACTKIDDVILSAIPHIVVAASRINGRLIGIVSFDVVAS